MSAKLKIVEGETKPKPMQLTDDGENLDGTGLTITLEIQKYAGGEYTDLDDPPTVAWLSQAGGTVEISDTETMAVGNYYARFKLTNGAGEYDFVPSAHYPPDLWQVVPVTERR